MLHPAKPPQLSTAAITITTMALLQLILNKIELVDPQIISV